MVPTSAAALAILLTAIVPGYLTIYLWSRNKTWKGLQNDLQTVIKSITLSAVIQVLLLPYTLVVLYPVRDHLDRYPGQVAGWSVLTTLLLPYLFGSVAARITDSLFHPAAIFTEPNHDRTWTSRLQTLGKWITQPAAQPSVWDWAVVSRRLDGCYLIITWKDGTKAAGAYEIGSLALTTPEQQGLFLKTEWLLNDQDGFIAPVANSAGMLIPSLTEIRSIRLVNGETLNGEEQTAAQTGAETTEEGSIRLHEESERTTTRGGEEAENVAPDSTGVERRVFVNQEPEWTATDDREQAASEANNPQ